MIQLPIYCLIITPRHLTPCVFFSSALSPSIPEDRDLDLHVSHLQNKISQWHKKFSFMTLHPIFVCTQWHKFCQDGIGPLTKFHHQEQFSNPPTILCLLLLLLLLSHFSRVWLCVTNYTNFKIYTLDAIVDILCEALIHSNSKHWLCYRSTHCSAVGTTGKNKVSSSL